MSLSVVFWWNVNSFCSNSLKTDSAFLKIPIFIHVILLTISNWTKKHCKQPLHCWHCFHLWHQVSWIFKRNFWLFELLITNAYLERCGTNATVLYNHCEQVVMKTTHRYANVYCIRYGLYLDVLVFLMYYVPYVIVFFIFVFHACDLYLCRISRMHL